jgi:hypothetical protein
MSVVESPRDIQNRIVSSIAGYMSGFGNSFETEALPGALPMGGIRRSAAPTGCMQSSSPVRRSPRRVAPTSARGSIAFARR